MNDKPAFASLSAGLLARKGQAKPAMRAQLFKFVEDDDLGWNDMGTDMLTPEQAAIVSPAPVAQVAPVTVVHKAEERFAEAPAPQVVVQQEALSEAFAAPVATPDVVSPVSTSFEALRPKPRAAPGSKGKSAFTLRIDQERHLRLRLASAYAHRSAQHLLIDALDRFLDEYFPNTRTQQTVTN